MGNYITKNNLARFWEDCLSTFRMNGGQLLWQNPNPPTTAGGVSFSNQTVVLSQNVYNFKYIVVLFKSFNNYDFAPKIQKFDLSSGPYFNLIDGNGNTLESKMKFRQCHILSGTQLEFGHAYNGTTQDDTQIGPYKIYGTNDLGYIANASPLDSYPVGSFYISSNSTSPASLFGGTWERIKDRFLLGSGDTYSNGATGGEATHILTLNEMPSHNHLGSQINASNDISGTTRLSASGGTGANYDIRNTILAEGGGQAHNNMPPYLVVYMWKRTA